MIFSLVCYFGMSMCGCPKTPGFYITALTFTILGLATQTAKFGQCAYLDATELCSWLFLFISGLVGLSRLEWLPVAYEARFHFKGLSNELQNYQDHKANGETRVSNGKDTHTIDEVIENRESLKNTAAQTMGRIEQSNSVKYRIQKWSFILGILLMLLSRAISPLQEIWISYA